MILTGHQIREARALLGWGTPMLARRANVGFEIVLRAQQGDGLPPGMGIELRAIREALERAGVVFFGAEGGGPGVRLRKVAP